MVLVKLPFARLFSKSRPVVPVLRFAGPIGAVTPLRPGLNLTAMAGVIHRAFAMKGAKAVAIQINSPGGPAVQSVRIYKRLPHPADDTGLPGFVCSGDRPAARGGTGAAPTAGSPPGWGHCSPRAGGS